MVFIWPPWLRWLIAHRWARVLLAGALIAALVYHLAVTAACRAYVSGDRAGAAALCAWS